MRFFLIKPWQIFRIVIPILVILAFFLSLVRFPNHLGL